MNEHKKVFYFKTTEWFFYEIENKQKKVRRDTHEKRFLDFIKKGEVDISFFKDAVKPTNVAKNFVRTLKKVGIPIDVIVEDRRLKKIKINRDIKVYWDDELIK